MSDHAVFVRPRRWPYLVAAIVGLVVIAVVAAVALIRGNKPASATATGKVATAQVIRQTLTDQLSLNGVVGFGPARPLNNQLSGILTWLPRPGALIGNGETLYRVNDQPVIDLTGTVPAYRAMAEKATGPDVAQLNADLHALGFLNTGGGDPGSTFTSQTTAAVKQWQKALGLPETGDVAFGQVAFTPTAIRIATVTPALGDAASPGAALFTITGNVAQVTLTADASNLNHLKVAELVTITFPDGSTAKARITSIGAVLTPAAGSQNGPTVSAQAVLPDPKAAAAFEAATVNATLDTNRRPHVLTVPVTALLALREGGYAVAVDGPAGRHLTGVTVGLIVGDTAEVRGTGLAAGMLVEVGSA